MAYVGPLRPRGAAPDLQTSANPCPAQLGQRDDGMPPNLACQCSAGEEVRECWRRPLG